MANKLINDLTPVAAVAAADEVEIQKSGEVVTKKCTVTQLLVPEATTRQAQDDLLFDGTGIDDDGDITLNSNTWYLRDADLVTGFTDRDGVQADLDKHLVNLIRALDAKLYEVNQSVSGSGILINSSVSISALEILNIFTLPKVLITCPADSVIEVLSVSARLLYNDTPYDAGSNKLSVEYEGGDTLYEFTNAFIESASDVINRGTITADVVLPDNEDVVLTCAANPTAGNSTMIVYLTYKIHSIGLPV